MKQCLLFGLALLFLSLPLGAATNAPARHLTLTLQQAVMIAAGYNLETAAQKYDIAVARLDISKEETGWVPQPWVSLSWDRTKSENEVWGSTAEVGLLQKFRTGTSVSLALASSLLGNQGTSYGSDPAWKTAITLAVSQPLLSGAGTGAGTYQRRQLELSLTNTLLQFLDQVETLVQSTEQAYWKLYAAQLSLEVKMLSLKLARELGTMHELQVRLGILTRQDLIESRSIIANRSQELIGASNTVANAAANLYALLGIPQSGLSIPELTSRPATNTALLPVERLITVALVSNPSWQKQRNTLSKSALDAAYYKNLALPDLALDLSLSTYATRGSWGDAFGPAASGDRYKISGGLTLKLPWSDPDAVKLGQVVAASNAGALRTRAWSDSLERQIRESYRNANNARLNIIAAGRALVLADERLKYKTQQFALQLNSNTDVLQAQQDYLSARDSYNTAVVNLNSGLADLNWLTGQGARQYRLSLTMQAGTGENTK